MTEQEKREYVEQRWTNAQLQDFGYFAGKPQNPERYGVYLYRFSFGANPSEAWSAAYDFTIARERQIAEVEEEIALVRHAVDLLWKCSDAWNRILARLESIKAELKKGMKEAKSDD